MADDQSQRPYRASEPPPRGPAKAHGSDPLAELARLIGQTDPFGEFGRESARRAPMPQPEERTDWNPQPAGAEYVGQTGADVRSPAATQRLGGSGYFPAPSTPEPQPGPATQDYGSQDYGSQGYGRQPYGSAPTETFDDLYRVEQEARGYPPSQAGHEQDEYAPDAPHQTEDEYYDDVPPSRRRLAVMAIAGVFALAVIGTAGAFGYRALFGSSNSNQPPPVIKADAGPSKIVPAAAGKDTQLNKLITDRVNERGQSEKLVSREEQPVDKPTTVVLSQAVPQPAPGSGVIASEPKKVRTIAIRPDQPVAADASPPSPPPFAVPPAARAAAQAPPMQPAQPTKPPPAPPRAAADTTTADAEMDSPPPAARSAPPSRQAPASSNAPLSLNPDAAPSRAPTRTAPPQTPARTAAVAPPAQAAPAAPAAASAGAAGSYVQISSQRSEADAQAAFRGLQAKFPTQLGGRHASVHKVDLGAKGTYYRAMVGPFANANEAAELCSSLKAAGGQCLIQRN
jgi:hypothetical protein